METKMQRYHSGKLTVADKLAILIETKAVLGRGGKNWIQGTWYGKRLTPEAWLAAQFRKRRPKKFDKRKLFRQAVGDPREANCFCLEGAVYRAAYNLGYSEHLLRDHRAAESVSLAGLIKKQDKCKVHTLNDKRTTTWPVIKKRLDDRIKELRKQQNG
jgi:hypothetical protein